MSNKFYVTTLRSVRKVSNLARRIFQVCARILGKVENKFTRLIVSASGSFDGSANISASEMFYREFPYLRPVYPSLPNIKQRPSVTVFAFLDPRGFYGGIATLLCVAAQLAIEKDFDLRIVQTTGFSDKANVSEFLESKGFLINDSRISTINLSQRSADENGYLPLHPEDIVVVSAWWDAHVAAQLPLKRKFIYLIQDFEPIFYNSSDHYVLAESTYHSKKFIPILNTKTLYTFFAKNNYNYIEEAGIWFEPAPKPVVTGSNSSHLFPKKELGRKRLFLYGRPNVHRNLYYSAIKAIELALIDSDLESVQWDVYSAGAPNLPSIKLSNGIVMKNLGKMSMGEYYKFASTVDIAVSPMLAPHPNYPTLELASLGATVITTKWRTKTDLTNYSKNILLAEPTIEGMASMIKKAAKMTDEQRKNQLKSTVIGDSWPATLEKPIKKLLENNS